MTQPKIPARDKAAQHIKAALDTGVRGDVREHLRKALDAALAKPQASLTALDYERLPCGGRLADPDRPGLLMRHGKRTGKGWLYRHVDPVTRKNIETPFGSYPAMSVSDARATWTAMRDRVKAGQPADEASKEAATVITMGELVDTYLSTYASQFKRSWRMDETYLRRHIIPHYGALPADQFTPDHVRAILDPVSKSAPREAEKIRGVLSSMFNVATRGSKKLGTLSGGTWLPPTTPNPVTSVVLPERETKSHKPTRQEMETLLRALDAEGDIGEAIRLQAQTCARVSEVAELPWSEIDLDAGEWLLPAARSKNGHAHRVMLSRQSVALLEARKAGPAGQGAFVFPGLRVPHITRNNVSKAFASIRKAHGLPDGFTSHALRHACLTWLAEQQSGRDIRDRISNHVEKASTDAVYNAAELNTPARNWLQRWCDHLDALEAENVMVLRNA